MIISTKGEYGVKAVLDLALRYNQGPIQTGEIAKRQNIPELYLVQILSSLKKAGYINSIRGPHGGHILIVNPSQITIGELIKLLDGSILSTETTKEKDEFSSIEETVLSEMWNKINKSVIDILYSITLEELCKKIMTKTNMLNFRI